MQPEPTNTPDGTTAATGDDDPFGLTELLAQAPVSLVKTKRGGFAYRKPSKTEYFRVHPDVYLPRAFIYEHSSDGMDRESYWVLPKAAHLLDVRTVELHLCANRAGAGFLWGCKIPNSDDNARTVATFESALQVAAEAKDNWTRMFWNTDGFYDRCFAEIDLGKPEWPDLPLDKLIALAFRPAMIVRDEDHMIVQRLRGAV